MTRATATAAVPARRTKQRATTRPGKEFASNMAKVTKTKPGKARKMTKPEPAATQEATPAQQLAAHQQAQQEYWDKQQAKKKARQEDTIKPTHQCIGAGCVYCLKQRELAVAKADAAVRRVAVDVDVVDVFRDHHGIVYLRVAVDTKKRQAEFVVNHGFSVDLVTIPMDTIRSTYMQPVVGASILECAKQLLRPLNQSCTIQQRAKEHLISICEDERIANMATTAKAQKKFAVVNAPAAKPAKGEKAPKAVKAPKAPKAAKPAGERTASAYTGKKITVLKKDHGAREGTKRAQAMEILIASKNTDDAIPKLAKIGADNSFIRYAVEAGIVKLA